MKGYFHKVFDLHIQRFDEQLGPHTKRCQNNQQGFYHNIVQLHIKEKGSEDHLKARQLSRQRIGKYYDFGLRENQQVVDF